MPLRNGRNTRRESGRDCPTQCHPLPANQRARHLRHRQTIFSQGKHGNRANVVILPSCPQPLGDNRRTQNLRPPRGGRRPNNLLPRSQSREKAVQPPGRQLFPRWERKGGVSGSNWCLAVVANRFVQWVATRHLPPKPPPPNLATVFFPEIRSSRDLVLFYFGGITSSRDLSESCFWKITSSRAITMSSFAGISWSRGKFFHEIRRRHPSQSLQ